MANVLCSPLYWRFPRVRRRVGAPVLLRVVESALEWYSSASYEKLSTREAQSVPGYVCELACMIRGLEQERDTSGGCPSGTDKCGSKAKIASTHV